MSFFVYYFSYRSADRVNQIPLVYKYGEYVPKKLPDHSFHMIRSEDIATVTMSIMELDKLKENM